MKTVLATIMISAFSFVAVATSNDRVFVISSVKKVQTLKDQSLLDDQEARTIELQIKALEQPAYSKNKKAIAATLGVGAGLATVALGAGLSLPKKPDRSDYGAISDGVEFLAKFAFIGPIATLLGTGLGIGVYKGMNAHVMPIKKYFYVIRIGETIVVTQHVRR